MIADERFWAKVTVAGPDECWLWTGSKYHDGYGQVARQVIRKSPMRAHVYSLYLATGSFPADGQVVMHSCDVRACVNPAHLSIGSVTDNNRDAAVKGRHKNSRKTHCDSGHPLSGENLYINPASGGRTCRECVRRWNREYKARKKVAV